MGGSGHCVSLGRAASMAGIVSGSSGAVTVEEAGEAKGMLKNEVGGGHENVV